MPLPRLISAAFDQLYTRFAWAYDLVSNVVSFGEWQEWAGMATVFIPSGVRVLEIAHGPGHLHECLREMGRDVVGIDLSPQMSRMTYARIAKSGKPPSIAQADAARLPFCDGSVGCIVATFPAGFIFNPDALRDMRRVLLPRGRVVIVPGARLIKDDPLTRLVKFAYCATGQQDGRTVTDQARALIESEGYTFWQRRMGTARAAVTVWVLKLK